MAKQTKPENPLFSRNIPAPPLPGVPQPTGRERNIPVSEQNGIPVSEVVGVQGGNPKQGQVESEDKEKATIELSLYLRPSQDDKLEDLRRAYKRRTKKKISANEVMRRLIEKATLEDLL